MGVGWQTHQHGRGEHPRPHIQASNPETGGWGQPGPQGRGRQSASCTVPGRAGCPTPEVGVRHARRRVPRWWPIAASTAACGAAPATRRRAQTVPSQPRRLFVGQSCTFVLMVEQIRLKNAKTKKSTRESPKCQGRVSAKGREVRDEQRRPGPCRAAAAPSATRGRGPGPWRRRGQAGPAARGGRRWRRPAVRTGPGRPMTEAGTLPESQLGSWWLAVERLGCPAERAGHLDLC